jgi:hypothetical protein
VLPDNCATLKRNDSSYTMEIIKRLPHGGELSGKSYRAVGDDGNVQVTIGVEHEVETVFCSEATGGSATIKYIIHAMGQDKCNSSFNIQGHLNVNKRLPDISHQGSGDFQAVVSQIRAKMPFDASALTSVPFDMRGLCYVLGNVAGIASTGNAICNILQDGEMATGRTVSNTWHNPSGGDLLIPPQFLKDSNEWCTLAYLLKAAGGHSMVFLGDTLPGAGRVLDRSSLSSFCLRMAAGIISTSQALGSASHHMLAFQRGLHSSLTLHSHSSHRSDRSAE